MSQQTSSPREPRRVWLWVLLILIGVVLLFPGACAAIVVVTSIGQPALFRDSLFVTLWLVCFAISAGGIALIWWAVRRLRRSPAAAP